MAVLQQYYTSYVNRETSSAGFQVKAMSPGITDDTQATIARLISYRIPSTLDEYAIDSHPVALRYFYRNAQEAILLCSQSNGTDENGRPGNFFAHTLVTEPDFFASMPPILYWRSGFWRAKDPGTSTALAPLNSLEEIEAQFDIEGVWSFLAQGRRIEQFKQLMCAVVHCNKTQRRIVIIDSADNVAQWVAAITIMLPPDYRPLLSFATYHHDPYQSQFMVTGTTSDSSFRASPDEYMSYFILNVETGKMSEVADSPYADEAARAARSYEEYESKLLSLITDYMPRFPRPTRIDELLDLLATYAGTLEATHPLSLSAQELAAIHVALTTFEEMRFFTQEDLEEMRRLHEMLQETYESQPGEEIYTEFRRIVGLLQKHKVPTDKSALREMVFITKRLISNADPSPALQRLEKMRQTYGEGLLLDTVNSPAYLKWLSELAATINTAQLAQIWKYPGMYINPSPGSQPFVIASLSILGERWSDKQARREVKLAVEVMIQAMAGKEMAWLQLIAANNSVLPERIIQRFYCYLVGPLPLDTRPPYRDIIARVDPGIDVYELHHEIGKAGAQNGLAALQAWIDHAQRQRMTSIPELVDEGLSHLKQMTPPEQAPELAAHILTRTTLPLTPRWENELVTLALSGVSLSHYSPLELEMCKKYRDRPGIDARTRTIMDGVLAMSSGELDEELANRLYQHLSQLRPDELHEETKTFVHKFLPVCASDQAHRLMVNTFFFDWKNSTSFWHAYWHSFKGGITLGDAPAAIQVMRLLHCWFVSTPDTFKSPYTLQFFLLQLPHELEVASKNRGFQEAARVINARVEKERWRWYPLIEDYFTGRRNALLSMGQNLAAQLKKGRTQDTEEGRKQAAREQKERAELDERLAKLFSKKPRKQHHQIIGEIYEWQQRELFWSIYWTFFKALLSTASSAQDVLEVFAYWFDDAFTALRQHIYIPQQFFFELGDALSEAQKERGFREAARAISRGGQTYQWFGLIETYFEEPEKRFNPFKR